MYPSLSQKIFEVAMLDLIARLSTEMEGKESTQPHLSLAWTVDGCLSLMDKGNMIQCSKTHPHSTSSHKFDRLWATSWLQASAHCGKSQGWACGIANHQNHQDIGIGGWMSLQILIENINHGEGRGS